MSRALRADAPPFQAPPRFRQSNSAIDFSGANAKRTYPPAVGSCHGNPASRPATFGSVPAMTSLFAMHSEPTPQVYFNGYHQAGTPDANQGYFQSYSNTNSRRSSGSGWASSPSQPSPHLIPSSSGSITSQQIYACHPATTLSTALPTVLGKYVSAPAASSIPVGSDNEKLVEVNPHLSSDDHRHRVSWVIGNDPFETCEASYYGKRLFYDNFFDLGVKPPQHTILVVVGLDTSKSRGFPILEPEVGMPLVAFPITSLDVSRSWHLPQGEARPLDIYDVLNGIRIGMKGLIAGECCADFSLLQKFVLARRLRARRSEPVGLEDIDSLEAAVFLESKRFELEKAGVGEIPDMLAQAHARLNSYVFSSRNLDDRLQVRDFLGDKKHFKGLKSLGWKTFGEIEAYFLCAA